MVRFLPIIIFAALVVFFAIGLGLNSRLVPSPLVNKPAPAFNLPALEGVAGVANAAEVAGAAGDGARVSTDSLRGRVWVLNVWASWCVGCRVEHPFVKRLAGEGAYIVGLNYKDTAADARQWLDDWGNPYRQNAVDSDGATGLDWGVYGVPETFIIDAAGVIRHKHIGPLGEEDLQQTIRPLLVALRKEREEAGQ